jgi:hypothetical protein
MHCHFQNEFKFARSNHHCSKEGIFKLVAGYFISIDRFPRDFFTVSALSYLYSKVVTILIVSEVMATHCADGALHALVADSTRCVCRWNY